MKAVQFFKMVEVSNLATRDNNLEDLNLHYQYSRYLITSNTHVVYEECNVYKEEKFLEITVVIHVNNFGASIEYL